MAVAWINLQQRLIKNTPGFGPGPAGRTFAYSGLAMYESIVPGMAGYQSLLQQWVFTVVTPSYDKHKSYYWPASLNASMRAILTGFFTGAPIDTKVSAANRFSIDSLGSVFTARFARQAGNEELARSAEIGAGAAEEVLQWSGSDGTYAVHPSYAAPGGPGLWVPTPLAFAPPINPYGGTLRSFVPDLLNKVPIPPPTAYSENPHSDFYKMAAFVYDKSLVLTADESNIAKTWGDIPGNYNGPSHFTNIVTQLVVKEKLDLAEAAVLYAKHGMAIYDAGIPIFQAKYQYSVLRPITYIRNVIKISDWNTVIPTPAHPDYLSAHAVIAQACAEVLKEKFGKNYSFSDHTHDNLYGTRSYASFDAYAGEAAWSRVLAGIHYQPTAAVSLKVGKKVGELINELNLKSDKDSGPTRK